MFEFFSHYDELAELLTAALIPWTFISSILQYFNNLKVIHGVCLAFGIQTIFFISWLLIITALVRALSSTDNPSDKIEGKGEVRGVYYHAGLYEFNFLNCICNYTSNKSKKSLGEFIDHYPDTQKQIISELAFEHQKLIYIRDIKLYRINFALKSGVYWILILFIMYIFLD